MHIRRKQTERIVLGSQQTNKVIRLNSEFVALFLSVTKSLVGLHPTLLVPSISTRWHTRRVMTEELPQNVDEISAYIAAPDVLQPPPEPTPVKSPEEVLTELLLSIEGDKITFDAFQFLFELVRLSSPDCS